VAIVISQIIQRTCITGVVMIAVLQWNLILFCMKQLLHLNRSLSHGLLKLGELPKFGGKFPKICLYKTLSKLLVVCYLPVMEDWQAESLSLCVRPKIRLKAKRVDRWHECLDDVQWRPGNRGILRHVTPADTRTSHEPEMIPFHETSWFNKETTF